MKTILSFDEYRETYKDIIYTLGLKFSDVEAKLAYKLYLAYESENVDKIRNMETEIDINSIFYLQHRFN
jgi:hypothetical protein